MCSLRAKHRGSRVRHPHREPGRVFLQGEVLQFHFLPVLEEENSLNGTAVNVSGINCGISSRFVE